MSDTLSAMREYRFLDDKRNASGLSDTEETRWRDLGNQLQMAPAAEAPQDPVAYAQALVAQGYDPVQAFLHVGFTLDQIAAAGYDVAAHQQAQQAYDPHAYAQQLLAQGYDAATAYGAAGLPVPETPTAPPPAAPAPEPEPEFADAELMDEPAAAAAPAAEAEADPTGGWTAETVGTRPVSAEQAIPKADPWRSPSPSGELPEAARVVPMVDDVTQNADELLKDAAWGVDKPEAATAPRPSSAERGAADPFAPSEPLPLPDGASLVDAPVAAPVEAALPAEPERSPFEPTPVAAAAPEADLSTLPTSPMRSPFESGAAGAPTVDLAESTESVEMGTAGVQAGGGLEGIPEIDMGAGEPAELELETGPASAPQQAFGGEIDLEAAPEPTPEANSRFQMPAELDLAAGNEPALELAAEPVAEAEAALEASPATMLVSAVEAPPVIDAAPATVMVPAIEAPPELEASPATVMVEAVSPPPELVAEPVIENAPVIDAAPVIEAPAIEAEPVIDAAPVIEAPAIEAEPVIEAPAIEAEPVIDAAPVVEAAPVVDAAPMIDAAPVVEQAIEVTAEVAPAAAEPIAADGANGVAHAPAVLQNPPWPTRSELSEWRSADKAEYVAWSWNEGGIEPYAELPEESVAAEAPPATPVYAGEPEPVAPLPAPDRATTQYDAHPAGEEEAPIDGEVLEMSEPVIEAAPVIDAAPVMDAAPVLDAAPLLDAQPMLEADVVLEPVLDAQPLLEAPLLEAAPMGTDEAPMAIDESEFVPGSRPAVPLPAPVVAGENRVIVHLVEGAVKRGTVQDIDLGADAVVLHSQIGAETIRRERIKAVFFMLAPGAPPPQVEGSKLRITFHDGRQLVGYSDAYDGQSSGFFVIPADARTNTQRIYVYQGAVRQVARG